MIFGGKFKALKEALLKSDRRGSARYSLVSKTHVHACVCVCVCARVISETPSTPESSAAALAC